MKNNKGFGTPKNSIGAILEIQMEKRNAFVIYTDVRTKRHL